MAVRPTKPAPILREVIDELKRKPPSSATLELLLAVIRASGSRQRPRRAWTVRDEANALTVYSFRHSFLEELHAGKRSPLLDDPTLSRITDAEMKKLMIESSARLAHMLRLRAEDPDVYMQALLAWSEYCANWERVAETVMGEVKSKPESGTASSGRD